ncbi:MAG: sulfite exporter TauE/SafE family protein [Bacteroidales bacterium]
MELNLLAAALMLGLAGSFHCAGMCGPIALAMPLNTNSFISRINGAIRYNAGRAITYSIMGAIFGMISSGFSLAGFQKWISIGMGTLMILSAVLTFLSGKEILETKRFDFLLVKLKITLGKLLTVKSKKSLLAIGLLNGLLPCGLVYVALAGALAAGNLITSVLFMFIFGLGTLPMLFFISVAGNSVSVAIRRKMTRLIPVFVILVGTLYILRGLSLGIPYLSPSESKLKVAEKSKPQIHNCCTH